MRSASSKSSIAHSSPMPPSARVAAEAMLGSGSAIARRRRRGAARWRVFARLVIAAIRRHRPQSVRVGRLARRRRRRARLGESALVPSRCRRSCQTRPRMTTRESAIQAARDSASASSAKRTTKSFTHGSSSRDGPPESLERVIARHRTLRRGGQRARCRPAMRMRGLEPPRPFGHTDLNRARLPIPPHPRGLGSVDGERCPPSSETGRLTPR